MQSYRKIDVSLVAGVEYPLMVSGNVITVHSCVNEFIIRDEHNLNFVGLAGKSVKTTHEYTSLILKSTTNQTVCLEYGYAVDVKPAAQVPIERSTRGGLGVPVFVQDQTSQMLDVFFSETLSAATLATDTVVDAYTLEVNSGHGLIAGNVLEIASLSTGNQYMIAGILNVVGNIITLDTPINNVYTVGDSVLVETQNNMNVDGSTVPQVFRVEPLPSQAGDFNRIIFVITDDADMGFDEFGGLGVALTRGVVIRKNNGDGTYTNIGNFKTNGEIENYCFDRAYFSNNGGGVRGFSARLSFNGQDKHGVSQRVDGTLGESLEVVIQDDLSGLLSFTILAQGSELQG